MYKNVSSFVHKDFNSLVMPLGQTIAQEFGALRFNWRNCPVSGYI